MVELFVLPFFPLGLDPGRNRPLAPAEPKAPGGEPHNISVDCQGLQAPMPDDFNYSPQTGAGYYCQANRPKRNRTKVLGGIPK
jgi:hypothetical protein